MGNGKRGGGGGGKGGDGWILYTSGGTIVGFYVHL